MICQVRVLRQIRPQMDGVGWFPAELNSLSGASGIRNTATRYTATLLGGSVSMCQQPRPNYCLCPSSLPHGGYSPTDHCYPVCWGQSRYQTAHGFCLCLPLTPCPVSAICSDAHIQVSQCMLTGNHL